jgi:hypothetical protein
MMIRLYGEAFRVALFIAFFYLKEESLLLGTVHLTTSGGARPMF